jgi:L-rhamnose-H+ transport protein
MHFHLNAIHDVQARIPVDKNIVTMIDLFMSSTDRNERRYRNRVLATWGHGENNIVNSNPLLGVPLCWLGGLASASFYVPFREVRGWSWETYWLANGIVSWIVMPWLMAWLLTNNLFAIFHAVPTSTILWTYFFGVLWGVGGLTFGLTMRYLGMSLGMAVAMGNCAVFGTLIPPLFHGQFGQLLSQRSGIVTLTGVGVCALGILLAGAAGVSKESETSDEQKTASIREFDLKLGLAVGTFAGAMSACFAFGLDAGNPIKALAVMNGTGTVWQGLSVLMVVLAGGFTTNLVWCLVLNARNRSYGEYLHVPAVNQLLKVTGSARKAPSLFGNYFFSGLAGAIWYFGVFFYTMGESQMGSYKFSSWTLLNASIIIFSTLWGIALNEWRGVSLRTKALLLLSLTTLVGSTVIVGSGSYLGTR